jgi:LL-diaminopimelate aminotransferase
LQEAQQLTQYYLENAALLKKAFENLGSEVYGGSNAPYLWVRFKNRLSWDVFHHFLENYHLITTPGSGFGSAGEGFLRLTAFGHRSHIQQALERLKS